MHDARNPSVKTSAAYCCTPAPQHTTLTALSLHLTSDTDHYGSCAVEHRTLGLGSTSAAVSVHTCTATSISHCFHSFCIRPHAMGSAPLGTVPWGWAAPQLRITAPQHCNTHLSLLSLSLHSTSRYGQCTTGQRTLGLGGTSAAYRCTPSPSALLASALAK